VGRPISDGIWLKRYNIIDMTTLDLNYHFICSGPYNLKKYKLRGYHEVNLYFLNNLYIVLINKRDDTVNKSEHVIFIPYIKNITLTNKGILKIELVAPVYRYSKTEYGESPKSGTSQCKVRKKDLFLYCMDMTTSSLVTYLIFIFKLSLIMKQLKLLFSNINRFPKLTLPFKTPEVLRDILKITSNTTAYQIKDKDNNINKLPNPSKIDENTPHYKIEVPVDNTIDNIPEDISNQVHTKLLAASNEVQVEFNENGQMITKYILTSDEFNLLHKSYTDLPEITIIPGIIQ
jgi:hypothetical protein